MTTRDLARSAREVFASLRRLRKRDGTFRTDETTSHHSDEYYLIAERAPPNSKIMINRNRSLAKFPKPSPEYQVSPEYYRHYGTPKLRALQIKV